MIIKIISPRNKYKDNNIYSAIVNYCLNPEKCISGLVTERNLTPGYYSEEMYELADKWGKL